jgi:hypothetical protein
LPHRAVAKIDMRLVPDMNAADALAALKAHLAKRGFGDIEVNRTGGYDPTSTSADSALIKAQVTTYKKFKSIRYSSRATRARTRVMSLRANRSSLPRDILVSVTVAACTHPTSITSSNPPTRRYRDSTAR